MLHRIQARWHQGAHVAGNTLSFHLRVAKWTVDEMSVAPSIRCMLEDEKQGFGLHRPNHLIQVKQDYTLSC